MELYRVEKGMNSGVGSSLGDNDLERVEGKAARRGGRGEVRRRGSMGVMEDGSSS